MFLSPSIITYIFCRFSVVFVKLTILVVSRQQQLFLDGCFCLPLQLLAKKVVMVSKVCHNFKTKHSTKIPTFKLEIIVFCTYRVVLFEETLVPSYLCFFERFFLLSNLCLSLTAFYLERLAST